MIWLGKVCIARWPLALPGMCWYIPGRGDGAGLEVADLLGVRPVKWLFISTSGADDAGGHYQSVSSSGISNVN